MTLIAISENNTIIIRPDFNVIGENTNCQITVYIIDFKMILYQKLEIF